MNYTLNCNYSVGEEVWFVKDSAIYYGKIVLMEASVSSTGYAIKYILQNGLETYLVAENMIFSTIELALEYIINDGSGHEINYY